MNTPAAMQRQATARSKGAVEALFDEEAEEYLARYRTPENVLSQQRMLRLLGERRLSHVLDIGCGPGTVVGDLLDRSEHVTGVDLSERMVAAAEGRFADPQVRDRVEFHVGDAERLPFPSEQFDAVICAGVLRYLPSLEAGLREIRRVLRPGGVAVVSFYYRYSPHWWSMCLIYRPLLPLVSLLKGRPLSDSVTRWRAEPLPFSYRRFRRTITKVGLDHVTTAHAGFDLFPLNRLFPGLSRAWYTRVEPVLGDARRLGWLGSICLVKVTKPALAVDRARDATTP